MTVTSKTHIIATLGPASSRYETIRAMYQAGATIFRLNFSHGTHDDHLQIVGIIRRIERETGVKIGILADLQGPKLRIGTFENEYIELSEGMRIRFDLDPAPGNETRVNFPHPDVIDALHPQAKFLMDDGNVSMNVVEKGDGYFIAEVENGGKLSNRKGVNVPNLSRPIPSLTEKDLMDLDFALGLNVDYIAQSFVQTADDVAQVKKIVNSKAKIIAKIEKPDAIKNINEILQLADLIMIARGDLGVEMNFELVPPLQKFLAETAKAAGKPFTLATQMFESMMNNPRPTRAEANDVAQAVLDGAWAVMLSGETASGKHPVESVKAMAKVCREIEAGSIYSLSLLAKRNQPTPPKNSFAP